MTDRWTDGQTDGGDCNIPDAFLKKRGDNETVNDPTTGPEHPIYRTMRTV